MPKISLNQSTFSLNQVNSFSNPVLDIYGFTGYSEADDAIVVAFRGTVDIQNWIANIDAAQVNYQGCQGCLVHQGFYNAFQSIAAYLRKNVQSLQALFRDAKIYVTGHSLGGGLATLGALDIKEIFGRVDQFYSFGQPRVGNELLSTFFTNSIPSRFRVIHYADIVPHLPPQTPLPYAHFSFEIWYDTGMKTYKTCGAEQFKCSKSVLPFNWSTSDGDIKYYIRIPVPSLQKEEVI